MSADQFVSKAVRDSIGSVTGWLNGIGTSDLAAQDVIDELKAAAHAVVDEFKAAGYAIVELPQPDSTRYDGDEHEPADRLAWGTGGKFAVSCWGHSEVQIAFDDEPLEPVTIIEARRIAACLLAAADAAEATS